MNRPEDIASPETEAVLQRIGMRHRGRRRAITLVLLAALVGGGVWWWTARSAVPAEAMRAAARVSAVCDAVGVRINRSDR